MLSVIASFNNMDGLGSTPQYAFSKGMIKFKQEEYDATVCKLGNNLIGMNTVDIEEKKQIIKDICIIALSYVKFLKG